MRRFVFAVTATIVLIVAADASAQTSGSAPPPARSWPSSSPGPSAVPAPSRASARAAFSLPAGWFMDDTIVSNSNKTLKNSDTYPDWEDSIAINPKAPAHISILGFSSCWRAVCDANNNAVMFTTTGSGKTWTKSFTITPPPGGQGVNGCPCDQAPDYSRAGTLFGTFLTEGSSAGFVYSGSTTNPLSASSWLWPLSGGNAVQTNAAGTDADQPQLIENRDPSNSTIDDTYVAYDDFAPSTPTPHVAAAQGTAPPVFTIDNAIGTAASCCVNPGLRIAGDSANGTIYAAWQQATFNSVTSPKVKIQYMLNQSTDGGKTWGLNGSAHGIQLASGPSDQIYDSFTASAYKFGTDNALLGGIDSIAVDPATHDVYYVYGLRDPTTANNGLWIVQLTPNGAGGLNAGTPVAVTGQVQAALPSIAIASNGALGVEYISFNGIDSSSFPTFTSHLAESTDHGATWTDNALLQGFEMPANNGDSRQRVFGDYEQTKAVGPTFYGTFTANGNYFGRTSGDTDAIFFYAPLAIAPAVKSVKPNSLVHGTSGKLTATGTNFEPGAKASFSGTGVSVTSTTFVSPTKLTLNVAVSSTAALGARDLTITNPAGLTGTCAACFSVT